MSRIDKSIQTERRLMVAWPGKVEDGSDYHGCRVFFFFFLNICYLFVYLFCLRQVFVAACGLSLAAVNRGYSLLRCKGFSSRWPLLL